MVDMFAILMGSFSFIKKIIVLFSITLFASVEAVRFVKVFNEWS